jgi:CubicO group peptidase (beta-lactamase class C family)
MRLLRFSGFVVILLGLTFHQPAQAQTLPPFDIDDYVSRAMKVFNVPGLSIGIVKDGKVVLVKGYGLRKLAEPGLVDENTLFGIGSNTKAFTSAALATLVDERKIAWDDAVFERLPGFQMYDSYASHEMTIRDLLTHRSGMGLGEGDLLIWPHTTYTREEIIYRLRFMKPMSSFRSHYAYDNIMYIAAGQIIPAVTGKSWDAYIRERILMPLGMNSTTLTTDALKPGVNFASPHSEIDGKLQPIELHNLDNAAPAGSINSSAADMAKWLLLQLDHGKIPGGETRIFSDEQSGVMWSAQTVLPISSRPGPLSGLRPNFSAYALGWALRDYHGRKLVGHTGGVSGYVSRVMLVPEERLGVVILTNAEQDSAFDSLLFHILDHYLGLPAADWIEAFKAADDQEQQTAQETMKKAQLARVADSSSSLSLERYAGTYSDPWYGTISIQYDKGKLVLRFDHTPSAVADLFHWQNDTFQAHWRDRTIEDAFVTFTLRPDGSIDHFTMTPVSPLADFSFDYQDLWLTPVPKNIQ